MAVFSHAEAYPLYGIEMRPLGHTNDRMALVFLPFLAVILTAIPGISGKNYDGYSLFQVYPDLQSKVDYLNSLQGISSNLEIQIWRQGTTNHHFDILVSPKSKDIFLKNLDEKNIRYALKIENVQDLIDKEKKPVSSLNRAISGLANANKFTKYQSLEEINTFIQSLAQSYPKIVKIDQIGKSFEKRPIYVVKVGLDTGKKKPSIWIDGGIHAREWISVSTVLYMLNKLVTTYSNNTQIKNFVDKADWYFVPVVNVDGYKFTHTNDRMWRKNRRPAPCRFAGCCPGVDLNRNFAHAFGGEGTSGDSCKEEYRGTAAFSEPETKAVQDFVMKNAKDMKAFISLHSFLQMWFYPYSDKKGSYPEDVEELASLSKKAAEAMKKPYGTEMKVGTTADILYEAAGGAHDWAKAVAKIKYPFCLELRPNSDLNGNGFILPPSHIVPAGEETWAGVSVVAEEVIKKFAS